MVHYIKQPFYKFKTSSIITVSIRFLNPSNLSLPALVNVQHIISDSYNVFISN